MHARILRLTERFDRSVRRLAVQGTPGGKALFSLIGAMQSAELPGLQDAETLFPPVARYWFRRVPGHNIWLFFAFSDAELIIVGLSRTPPVPLLE